MPAGLVIPPFAQAVLSTMASFALSKISERMTDDSSMQDQQTQSSEVGIQVNQTSTEFRLPLLYGQSRVGVNRVFARTSGSDNKYLHLICVLGEGEIDGFSAQVGGTDPVYLNNRLYTDYGASNVHYELFTGSSSQTVCSTLQNATIADADPWLDSLRHTAYIYVRLRFDRDKFQSIPDVTVGVKGAKLYNPTTEITAYSNNPALCVYDLLTRPMVRGGFGISASDIDIDEIEAARSYCASKGWTCNMPIKSDLSIVDNLQLVLNNFRGAVLKSGTQYSLKFKDLNEESVVDSFNSSSIVDGSLVIKQSNVFDKPSSIKIIYYNENSETDGTSSYKESAFIFSPHEQTLNSGEGNIHTVKCFGLSNFDMVQKMAYYYMERLSLQKEFTFQASQKATRLEPMDLITITHDVPGWEDKYGRVTTISINDDDTVNVSCIEEHTDFYDEEYDISTLDWYDTTLPDPTAPPLSVTDAFLSEEVYYYRNRSFTRLIVSFSKPDTTDDPFFDYVELYVRIGDTGEYKYITKTEGNYIFDPVDEGDTYYVKLKSVSIFGVRGLDINDVLLSKIIIGKTSVPSNLFSMTAVANGDSVSIYADPISDPDIEGYEVRLGSAWAGAIFISFNKNCSLRLNGVRPGIHTFWMSPKDNAGNYSTIPVSATVKVFVPPGYTQLPTYGSWSWDFTAGAHNNTEHAINNSEDAIKCSHTNDVLTGVWTSPTYDLNAVEDVRVWGDFRTDFISTDTTWSGVAPPGTTWNDLGNLSWMEIFNPVAAGIVRCAMKFSTNNINWSEASFFEILCAEISARYIKVEVTLTDPTLDSNLFLQELNLVAYEGQQ